MTSLISYILACMDSTLRFHRVAVLVMAAIASMAQAQDGGVKTLGPDSDSAKIELDRAVPAGTFYLYRQKLVAVKPGLWPRLQHPFSQVHFICSSGTDPSNGACRTSTGGSSGTTPIRLRFTERRSLLSVELVATAYIQRLFYGFDCPNWGSIYYREMQMTSTNTQNCGAGTNNGTVLTATISESELAKIPTGGVWTAKLLLLAKGYSSDGNRYPWTNDITIRVTDKNNIEAYLPQFGNAAPLVDLNLRTQLLGTAGSRMAGTTQLDLCLYDGFNSNSKMFELRVFDDKSKSFAGRSKKEFSVLHTQAGGATDAGNRIDYTVSLNYNGQRMELNNDETLLLPGVDTAQIRAMRVPNVPIPVVCSPTPMTLTTPAFNTLDKRAGRYEGKLSIVFTPSLLAP